MTNKVDVNLAAVILAAGESRRFDGIKQLADIGGISLINRVIAQYPQANISDVWVVLGASADVIAVQLPDGVRIIKTAQWQQGMGASLAYAITTLAKANYTHVFIGLGDLVALNSDDINAYIKRSEQYPQHIIATEYSHGAGVPAIFPQADFADLMALQGDKGAKSLLQQNSHRVKLLECDNARVDIDTQQQWQHWLQQS